MLKEQISDDFILETEDVKTKIFKTYGNRVGVILLGVWLIQKVLGVETLRSFTKQSTFFRYRKSLIDAGCSWDGKNHDFKEKKDSVA
jgi:hypothetical protein